MEDSEKPHVSQTRSEPTPGYSKQPCLDGPHCMYNVSADPKINFSMAVKVRGANSPLSRWPLVSAAGWAGQKPRVRVGMHHFCTWLNTSVLFFNRGFFEQRITHMNTHISFDAQHYQQFFGDCIGVHVCLKTAYKDHQRSKLRWT